MQQPSFWVIVNLSLLVKEKIKWLLEFFLDEMKYSVVSFYQAYDV